MSKKDICELCTNNGKKCTGCVDFDMFVEKAKMAVQMKGELKMKTNKEKVQELHDLAKPLSDWLYENGCPHDTILIQQDHVEFLSGEMAAPFELRD